MKTLLTQIMHGENLTEAEAARMLSLLAETDNPAQAGALLAALEMKGESVSELTGAARYLRENVTPINVDKPCVDVVGTGGDGGVSFNVNFDTKMLAEQMAEYNIEKTILCPAAACLNAELLEAYRQMRG